MTTDLWMLLASAGLQWGLIVSVVTGQMLANGIPWTFGNRDHTPEPSGLAGRLARCSANMQENLPLFAILVLVAHVSGQADSLTANGAITFFVARIAHTLLYALGIPYLRTATWVVSLVGMGMILVAIVG